MPESHEPVAYHELSDDEKQLAKLGYSQELHRSWSGFSNFAISFSIISILAGCFTSFALGWNNGGPAAIAWGWPILTVFILIIGMCMSELVSAYPTSGGIYWWASKLGGPAAGFYTGWLNLIGLVAIVASVAYGCATFLDATIGYFSSSWLDNYSLTRVFIEFVIILGLAALLNIFSSHLLAVLNNISVWWHVIGATVIVVVLWFFLKDGTTHASIGDVFASTVNNTGLFGGKTSGAGFLLYVLPLSGILTQYTITGYDASAHLSEETQAASSGAAKGIWRSIFYSGIGGWILLLSFLFAVQDKDGVTAGGGSVFGIFGQALTPARGGLRRGDLGGRSVLLHRGVHDQHQPDVLRLQPRRRDARRQALLQADQQPGAGQRRDRGRDHRADPDPAGADQGRHQRGARCRSRSSRSSPSA